MIAEIIAVGSEMLTPFRQDTNSLFLTQGLNDLGVTVAFKTIVGDSLAHLTGATRIALKRADLVVFSGGLGPTEDDLTREAAAAALELSLRRDAATVEALAKRFAERGIPMSPNNSKQADVLEGATVLPNAHGSAPGQVLESTVNGKLRVVVLLPGPPKELKPMFTDQVRPWLAERIPSFALARRTLRMALLPESAVDARSAPIYKRYKDVETTILAHSGEIQLHFSCAKPSAEEAKARVDALAAEVEQEMGDAVFSARGESLEQVVLSTLGRRNLTLAAAESCTGGLLSERLTAVPGSSQHFVGGAIVYTNGLKTLFADVAASILEHDGPVSEACARALAEGIRARTGASIGVSITGIAGPGGGTGADEGKPVGLVYIGLASPEGTEVKKLNILMPDRDRVRWWSSQHALELIRRQLL